MTVAANGVGELHRDVIDLNSDLSRKRFVGAVMQAAFRGVPPDDWADATRESLRDQLAALARVPPGSPEPPPAEPVDDDPRVAALADVPADVRAEAENLLCDPELVRRVSDDIVKAGVIGERALALTVYLCGVSTQLRRPLAIIVRGPSASGKSYVVDRVASLFPPEVVLHATSLTQNSLYYFPSGMLRHRFIVAGERSRMEDDDRAEATRALREMIESGRLTKAVPVKEADRIVTRVIEQSGPIAYVESTTLGQIFDEDRNRCLVVSTDEQQDQTARILRATAARAEGTDCPDLARLRLVHHALVRMLPRFEIVIPFASAVSDLFPSDRIDARRSFRHLLQLVEAVALLHFRQRDRDAAGRVVAHLRDYQLAARLAAGPLSVARGGVSDGARRFFGKLRERFKPDGSFTSAAAQAVGTWGRSTVRAWLNELDAAGCIGQTEPPRGNMPATWKLTGKEPDGATGGLLPADDVQKRLSERTHGRTT